MDNLFARLLADTVKEAGIEQVPDNLFVLPEGLLAWKRLFKLLQDEHEIVSIEISDSRQQTSREIRPHFVRMARNFEDKGIPFIRAPITSSYTHREMRADLGGIEYSPTILNLSFLEEGKMTTQKFEGYQEIVQAFNSGRYRRSLEDWAEKKVKRKIAEKMAKELTTGLAGAMAGAAKEREERLRREYEEKLRKQREELKEEVRRAELLSKLKSMKLNDVPTKEIKQMMTEMGISVVGLLNRDNYLERLFGEFPELRNSGEKSRYQSSSSGTYFDSDLVFGESVVDRINSSELENLTFDVSKETQSGPSWMTQYKKAIKRQGSVSLNIIRCVLVGPPKVGKSCLKHLLVHNEPKEVTTSTPVLESPEVVTFTPELYISHQGSSSVWQPIKNMGGLVKKWTMDEQYETQETTGMNQDEVGSRPHLPQKSTSTGKVSDDFEQTTLNTSVTGPISSHERLTALQKAHEDLQKDLDKGNLAHFSDQRQLTLIHVLDSGGQLAFQDTLPLLIGTPCTYITVFDASVDLDQPVDITYRAQDESEAKLDHQLSQWDMMLRTFSSVHTMEYKCHDEIRQILQDGSTLPHSHIAVVGTHKEKLETLPNRDDLKKKITLLGGIEESKPYRLLYDQHGNPYFLIDNLLGIDQDYINSLRKTLSSKECTLPLKVPLMWLMLELTTQRMDQKFIRCDELRQFCLNKKYIDEEDADAQFHSLLMFLHNLGFYAFYDLEGVSKADNWVCTDAATLYREVSKLLVVQYTDTYTKKATRSFRKTGIIEDTYVAELFNEVEINPEIDHRWFLNVLHHIGIVAKVALERCQQFFIPLVLPFNRAALPRKTSVSPLCFTLVFSDQSGLFCKQCECDLPRGIFPYLVVHLANQHHKVSGNEMWRIDPYHSDRTHIAFNCTTITIYLIEQAGHMELAILPTEEFFPSSMGLEEMQSKLHSLCQVIHQTVTTAINNTCEQIFGSQFARRAKVQSGFLCPCGEGGPHLTFLKSTESVQCSIGTTLLSRKLRSQEKIWFSPVESGVKFSLFEDVPDKYWIMEEISDTKLSSDDMCSATFQHGSNTDTGSEVDIRSFRSLVLGDLHSILLTHKGGIFPLHPFGLVGEECSAELTAPEGVIAEGVEVSVEYAILLSGPFKFPGNWQRVSVVLYLNSPKSNLLLKPISLKLRHWAVLSEDSSLCFVKASHVLLPKENEFVFTQLQNKNMFQFDSDSGLLCLQDQFCLCGICEKVETVSPDKGDIRCRGMLLEEPLNEGIQRFFLYIMYDAPEWITAFKKYSTRALVRGNYLHDPETLVCKSDKSITATMEKTEGSCWVVTISNDMLQYSELKDNLSSIDRHYKECEDKIASLREAMYPPSIKFTVTYARLKSLREPHVQEPNHVRLKSAAHCISFRFSVYSQDSGIQLSSSDTQSAPFDQKTFMVKYRDRFMKYVPADDVVFKWGAYDIIDENTRDDVKKAPLGDKNAILFGYIRKNGSLQTIRKMSDFLIETGDAYPHVKSLGEDMREDLKKYS